MRSSVLVVCARRRPGPGRPAATAYHVAVLVQRSTHFHSNTPPYDGRVCDQPHTRVAEQTATGVCLQTSQRVCVSLFALESHMKCSFSPVVVVRKDRLDN